MTASRVSCVIPTHDRPQFLKSSIESAMAQLLPPDEILVVSDVDDENAENLCRDAAQRTAIPIRYIRNQGNPGASSSRNLGASLAKGSHLAFLDDDDIWKPNYLRRSTEALGSARVTFSVCWLNEFNEHQEVPGGRMRGGLTEADVIAFNPGATGSNLLIDRHSFLGLGGFDESLPVKNDTDLLVRLLRAGHQYTVVEDALVLQRKHGSGQLTDFGDRRARGTLLFIAKHRSHLSRRNYRMLRGSFFSLRSRSASSRITRAWFSLLMVLTYDPRDTWRKLRAGRSGAMQRTVRTVSKR